MALDDQLVRYIVPLLDFERHLVSDTRTILERVGFRKECSQVQIATTFQEWKWSYRVLHCLNDDLETDTVTDRYHGSKGAAYNNTLNTLTYTGGLERSMARSKVLKGMNEGFLIRLGDRPIEEVQVVEVDDDSANWH